MGMKLKPFLLTIIVILLQNLLSFSQDERPLLLPEPGKQYIYEIINSQYIINTTGDRNTDIVKRKQLKIQYKSIQPENTNYLVVSVIENSARRPEHTPVQYVDYRFPYFKVGVYDKRNTNFYEELLTLLEFHYEFNKEKREVKLHNRAEILLQVRDHLNKKGFEKKEVDRYTEELNTKGIPEITKYLQTIFFISDEIVKASKGAGPEFRRKTEMKDSLVYVFHESEKKSIGLSSIGYSYNHRRNYLHNYNSIKIDTLKWPVTIQNERHERYFEEEELQLLSRKTISEDKLFISGTVKNVRNKKVTLAILRDPFGVGIYKETAFLDGNNSFKFETDFKHAGIVYLQFGLGTEDKNIPLLSFYAEPGSRIHIQADGNSFPLNVEYSGDFSREANMIHEFRTQYNLFYENLNFNMIRIYFGRLDYKDFQNASKNYDEFISQYKNKVNEQAFTFIANELKAQMLSLSFYYLSIKQQWLSHPIGKPFDPHMNDIDVNYLESKVRDYEIFLHYNDYGIYSRQLAAEMLEYHYSTTRKIIGMKSLPAFSNYYSFSEFMYADDLSHQVEVAKIILAGHALYSQLANLFLHQKMRLSYNLSKDAVFLQNEIEKYLEVMARMVNEPEFKGAIERMMNNHLVWQKEDYVPDVEFLNFHSEVVRLNDFMGKKPTIFFVTHEWGTDRYNWDDLARENPDMNLVLIMEGSNFAEWTDYISRAEPVAHQLFWRNNNLQLRDIFRRDTRHFIAYDKEGKRISFADNPVDAVNLVKQSLMDQKKDPDKSQLIIIIIALGILFAMTLLVFSVWKWRVRQRFRKEQQQRRLRELELTAIRSQMNPHFLFNCLNSVQNLVQQNKGREAHLYLADFAGLIRKVLINSEKEEVSLAEELDMVQQYLNLEKLRFDFDFGIHVSDQIDAHNTPVPSMLLQPFAENAVTHGLQNKKGERQLSIEVIKKAEPGNEYSSGKGILISIEDNGIGREAAQETAVAKNGKGTRLMQERLAILQQRQKEKYWLQTTDKNGNGATGTRVEIFIPEEN
jgi:hypothetical protein